MSTEEGNKLIAEFMGDEIDTSKFGENWERVLSVININRTPAYNSSWDWLMPCIHKAWDVTTEDERQFASIVLFELGLFTPMKELWEHLVEFIKWYNSQPK